MTGMTKSDLIARLAARYPQLVAKDADLAVKTILDAMTLSLSEGQRIEIRGFGSFGLNYRPPRVGRNPKSGDKVQVPEKHVPHFKAGKELRDRVDAGLNAGISAANGGNGNGSGVGAGVSGVPGVAGGLVGAGARPVAPVASAGAGR